METKLEKKEEIIRDKIIQIVAIPGYIHDAEHGEDEFSVYPKIYGLSESGAMWEYEEGYAIFEGKYVESRWEFLVESPET